MSSLGPTYTWKVVYYPKVMNAGIMGVALVEANTKQLAIKTFMDQYAGQYGTIDRCEKLG